MDREKVIKGLEIQLDDLQKYADSDEILTLTQEQAKEILSLLKEREWIPVTERLPKSVCNKVIVYLQHEELVDQIGYGHYEKYQGNEMWFDLESGKQFIYRGYKVTHWMPLPKAPNGEQLALS